MAPATPAVSSITRVTVQARTRLVTAVCQSGDGAVVLGFASGEVIRFRPKTGEVSTVWDEHSAVLSLATGQDGSSLFVVGACGGGVVNVTSLDGQGREPLTRRLVKATDAAWLCPEALGDDHRAVVGLWTGSGVRFLQAGDLASLDNWEFARGCVPCTAGVLLPTSRNQPSGATLLAFVGHHFACYEHAVTSEDTFDLQPGWQPAVPHGGSLRRPALNWLRRGTAGVEVTGITAEGQVYASEVRFEDDQFRVGSAATDGKPPYLAAALLRPGLVAAVTANAIVRLRREGSNFRILARTDVALAWPVACFAHHGTRELIVVCSDGTLVRVPIAGY